MARSKFYGYTMVGVPSFKRWSLSELPLYSISVYSSTTSSSVASGNNFPITGTIVNQAGSNLQNDSIQIPGGFYKISWSGSLTTDAAAQVIVNLVGSNGTISSTTGSTSVTSLTTTIDRDFYIVVPPTGTTIELVNGSMVSVTTGTDLQISITRLI